MGSPATLNGYIQGVRRFIEHLRYDDLETVLEKIKSSEINAVEALDQQGKGFIDQALEKYAHDTVRGFLFGIKKRLSLNDRVRYLALLLENGEFTEVNYL